MRATPADQQPFFHPYPGGESWAEFMFRACNALNRITPEYAGKKIVVCHGGIVEASFLFFCGLSTLQNPPIALDPDYTSITQWQKVAGVSRELWSLKHHNDNMHLHAAAHDYPIPTCVRDA